ncbi:MULTISPECIES: LamG-like jellyroll fold domain-containing protein [unclassified Lentimicrobium]|uniref:LamG-like jellyroll fold domain-containing protein n=1 Tax=unclassified Lentimicrobium TaxID=2677434 RepID=UPI00155378A2|nr:MULTISPECIES: LamG-like jellyroll fold domain-containing protein [unclassified Lentimicrobium]NPD44639.1 T9SS type A sorting domain-containing protein [Lentimicrobium sp. S6]NPD83351.1 T9SS type A sorting domain-containing protein [Lentimicrobium sp. L6]
MKNLLFLIILLFSLNSYSQSPVLYFDGNDNYVDIGPLAATNARTIEFWFNLEYSVDEYLQNEIILIGTEIPDPNVMEWHLSLTQAGTTNPPGTLRFVYVEAVGQVAQVYSDKNEWNANQWYHVAIVIDQDLGMCLFVDGELQYEKVAAFNNPINFNGANIEIGRQFGFNRYFNGRIDDLRISNEAIYLENFTPPCPDLMADNSTIGLWNFNKNDGYIANDSGPNNFDGIIHGATWDTAMICLSTNDNENQNIKKTLKVYPNPSDQIFNLTDFNFELEDLKISIYNSYGQLILKDDIETELYQLDLKNRAPGIYYYRILNNDSIILYSGKLVKQ